MLNQLEYGIKASLEIKKDIVSSMLFYYVAKYDQTVDRLTP